MVENSSKDRKLFITYYDFIKTHCVYSNFPKEGVNFIDIFPILQQAGFANFNEFTRRVNSDIILIPEARGFLFAQSFPADKEVFLRKKGKLPGLGINQIKAPKEYGEEILEFNESAILQIVNNHNIKSPITVTFFDDVLATGQTAKAVCDYFSNLTLRGYTFKVINCVFFLELSALKGREIFPENVEVYSFLTYKPE